MSVPCLEDCPVDGCPYACSNQTKGHAGDHVCANGHRWLIALDGEKQVQDSKHVHVAEEGQKYIDGSTAKTDSSTAKTDSSTAIAGYIRVRFKNASGFSETWTAVDEIEPKDLFVNRLFQGLEVFPDPDNDEWIYIKERVRGQGVILYQRQGTSGGARQDVTDGKEIGMY